MKNIQNVGFAIMRIQPMHKGHFRLINKMLEDNDIVVIGLGSVQEYGTIQNPFHKKDKISFIKKVYGENSKIKIIELKDQKGASKEEWVDYAFGQVEKMNLPKPTTYYCGSDADAEWYKGMEEKKCFQIKILERHGSGFLSATEIRKAISSGNNSWEEFVPACLINDIKEKFPTHLLTDYAKFKLEK